MSCGKFFPWVGQPGPYPYLQRPQDLQKKRRESRKKKRIKKKKGKTKGIKNKAAPASKPIPIAQMRNRID
jgi:hypothetical protein